MAGIRKRGETFTITAYMGYDEQGRQIKKTTTFRPPENVTENKAEKLARAFAATWEEKIKGYTALDENRTFAELVHWYYESVAPLQLKPNILIDNRCMINTYVMPTLARKKLKEITPSMLDALFSDMMKNGRTKDTYRLKDGVTLPKGTKKGVNLCAIASETGLSRNTVNRLSSGHSIERDSAEKIAACLGRQFCDMFESSVEDRALAVSTVSRVRRCLSAVFTAAVRKEIMRRNPVSNSVPISKRAVNPVTYLDETQALQLVAALDAQNDFMFKVMISTLLYTGMRGGELCGLQWRDIDMDRGVIYIRHTLIYVRKVGGVRGQQKGKGHERNFILQSPKTTAGERYVVMPASLLALFREYKRRQDVQKAEKGDSWNVDNMVFITVNGNYYSEQYLNKRFKTLAQKIGLPAEIHLHSLRHPYVKHTTKKYNSEKQKTQATKIDLIAWVFCFCIISYSKEVMDLVNNLNAVVGKDTHLFNQQIGQLGG